MNCKAAVLLQIHRNDTMNAEDKIKTVAVVGHDREGISLACHLANCGVKVFLISAREQDLQTEDIVKKVFEQLYDHSFFFNIHVLAGEEALSALGTVDWAVEATRSEAAAKVELLQKISRYTKKTAILSASLEGFSIELWETLPIKVKINFIGLSYGYPLAQKGLLELSPTRRTYKKNVEKLKAFCETELQRHTLTHYAPPGYLGVRLALYTRTLALKQGVEYGFSFETIDTLTGKLIGWPEGGVCKNIDKTGFDRYITYSERLIDAIPAEEQKIIAFYKSLKSIPGGFYKEPGLVYDCHLENYRPVKKRKIRELGRAFRLPEENRIHFLIKGPEIYAEFYRSLFFQLFRYVSTLTEKHGHSLYDIDLALKELAGWKLGIFDLWEMLGVRQSLSDMEKLGLPPRSWVYEMTRNGKETFYLSIDGERRHYDQKTDSYPLSYDPKTFIYLEAYRNKVVWQNEGCSIYDLGDEALNLEFHTYMNIIDEDVARGILTAIDIAEKNYRGLIIANQGRHFTVGANLGLVFFAAIERNYSRIDFLLRSFQELSLRIRYSGIPVFIAAHGMCYGGGCEMALHADGVICDAQTFIGMPEAKAGLLPAGGGSKESTRRLQLSGANEEACLSVFENIAFGKTSANAFEAIEMRILNDRSQVALNSSRRIAMAKEQLIAMADYQPPAPVELDVYGDTLFNKLDELIHRKLEEEKLTPFESKVARKIAHVMCGGGGIINRRPESYFLELEREAFVSLCGEKETLERLKAILSGKKPPRN